MLVSAACVVALGAALVLAGPGTIRWHAYLGARFLYAVVRYGEPLALQLGPSAYFLASVVAAASVGALLALASLALLAGRSAAWPLRLAALVAGAHGALGPLAALRGAAHLHPWGRGRFVLADAMRVVCAHQAYALLALGGVVAVLALRPPREGGRGLPTIVDAALLLFAGVSSRGLALLFGRGGGGASVAGLLEIAWLLAALGCAAVLVVARARRAGGGRVGGSIAAATLLGVLVTSAIASRGPAAPGAFLASAPVVVADALEPAPSFRAALGGLHVPREGDRVGDVFSGDRLEASLLARSDAPRPGKTGLFARFGAPRAGVLHLRAVAPLEAERACPPSRRGHACVVIPARGDEALAAIVDRVSSARVAAARALEGSAEDVTVLVAIDGRAPAPTRKDAPSVEPSAGCAQTRDARAFEAVDLDVRGQSRALRVTAPGGSEPVPLVIVLHGNGGVPEEMREGLALEARASGRAAFVYLAARGRLWDVDKAFAENRDVAFALRAIEWAKANLCVDARRVFATGYSAGGYLASQIACGASLRGVIVHSGGGGEPSRDDPDPPVGTRRCTPTPALLMHGDADPSVPVEEGIRGAERWRRTNGCAPLSGPRDDECVSFEGCAHPVGRCVTKGLGHWFSPRSAERTWTFIEAQR